MRVSGLKFWLGINVWDSCLRFRFGICFWDSCLGFRFWICFWGSVGFVAVAILYLYSILAHKVLIALFYMTDRIQLTLLQ